jgi:hypothetical protein
MYAEDRLLITWKKNSKFDHLVGRAKAYPKKLMKNIRNCQHKLGEPQRRSLSLPAPHSNLVKQVGCNPVCLKEEFQ